MYDFLIAKLKIYGIWASQNTDKLPDDMDAIIKNASDALEEINRLLDKAVANIEPSCNICSWYEVCFGEPKTEGNYQSYNHCHENGHSDFRWRGLKEDKYHDD